MESSPPGRKPMSGLSHRLTSARTSATVREFCFSFRVCSSTRRAGLPRGRITELMPRLWKPVPHHREATLPDGRNWRAAVRLIPIQTITIEGSIGRDCGAPDAYLILRIPGIRLITRRWASENSFASFITSSFTMARIPLTSAWEAVPL